MEFNVYAVLVAAALMLARIIPIVELMPVVSGPWFPRPVRFAIAIGLAALIAPHAIEPALLLDPPSLVATAGLFAGELAVGVVLGFLSALVFEGARMAGGIVDRTATLGDDTVEGPVARLYLLIAVALFFLLGGPAVWVSAVKHSYDMIGLLGGGITLDGLVVARMVADVLTFAVLMALPVVSVLVLAELVVAIASRVSSVVRRALPAASVRTLIAVASVALSLGVFADELGHALQTTMSDLPSALESLYVR